MPYYPDTTRYKVLSAVYTGMLLLGAYTLGRIDERDKLTDPIIDKVQATIMEATGLDKILTLK